MENEIKNAEQTNVVDNAAAQDTGAAVNGQAGSSAPAKQENNQEGVNGGASSNPSTVTGSEGQDDATNKKFAEMRRSYERRLKAAEKARNDALKAKEVEMVKKLYKTNQWTGEQIEDEHDVEELLAMQALADEGKDPLAEYPKYLKAQKKAAAQTAKEKAQGEAQKQTRVQESLQEFYEKHPDVNALELLADEDFLKFGKEALETVSLTKVYEAYLPIKTERDRIAAEKQKDAALAANSSVAVGSVTSATDPLDSEFFTPEQVRKMSREEIRKNLDKIRASQEKW